MHLDSPTDEPPPPAYDAEDFDRKISDAVERSLTIANQPATRPSAADDEEWWEEWDEAAFEAAAARFREQENGGSSTVVQPAAPQPLPRASSLRRHVTGQDATQPGSLHDRDNDNASSSSSNAPRGLPSPPSTLSRAASEKRRLANQDAIQARLDDSASSSAPPELLSSSPPPMPSIKERPRWLDVADVSGSNSASSSYQQSSVSPQRHIHQLPPEEDEHDEPLPPFAPVGPSLEGPPFEEVVRLPRLPPVTDADSPPQSPLDSVEDAEEIPRHVPPPVHTNVRHRAPALSRPPPPRTLAPPPSTMPPLRHSSPFSTSSRQSTIPFDASVAYSAPARQRGFNAVLHGNDSRVSEPTEVVDASSLYHSSVSSILKFQQTPMTPKKTNSVRSVTPGTTGRPSSSGGPRGPLPALPQGVPYQPQQQQQPQQHMYNNPYPSQNAVQIQPNQYAPYQQAPPQRHSPAPPIQQQQPYMQQQQPTATSFYSHPFQNVPIPPPHQHQQQLQPQQQWHPPQNNPYYGAYPR